MNRPRLRWQDCDPVFKAIAKAGIDPGPILVGGQALNLWLEYYAREGGPVVLGAPVASKDIDVLGDLAMAERCALTLGGRCTPINPLKHAVPMVAIVHVEDVRIDFQIDSEPNTKAEIEGAAIPLPTPWGAVTVMHPLHLLLSRAYNVSEIWLNGKRKYDNPYGLRQLQGAMDVFRCFARELTRRGDGRKMPRSYEALFAYANSDRGERLWSRKGIDLFRCIEPLTDLPEGFHQERFPRMWETMILRR